MLFLVLPLNKQTFFTNNAHILTPDTGLYRGLCEIVRVLIPTGTKRAAFREDVFKVKDPTLVITDVACNP